MNTIDHMAQLEKETGIDVADMMLVAEPRWRVLREITDGTCNMYIVTDRLCCTRCGHKWAARAAELPKFCPGCRSPYWNRPRQR